MRRAIEFFIKYPVWVSVLMFSVIMFGIVSLFQMRYSFFPEVKPDIITVQIPYPGASPDEVAEGVVLKIEESLDGINGVDRITSVSKENIGSLSIEIIKGYDINIVTTDVKNAIDRINSFPEDAEEPVIFSQRFRSRSLSIVVYGETDLYNLKYIAEQIRDELLATPEISLVDIVGLPELEFSIEISEANMRRYGISFDEISQAVKKANINLSGGKIETEDEEILIRVWGRDYYAQELLDIPLRTDNNGAIISLGEIADIKEQWEDIPDKQYYNDKAALILNIDQAESEDILAIAKLAKGKIAEFNQENDKVKAIVFDDRTVPLRQRLELMVKNGVIGLLLILVALGFFLNLRLSFWVAISIPFAFAGMFIVANLWPITINVISLFGMIIVVGILVDDAIVVGENIFSHYERGKSPYRAAVDGTKQVLAPVTTSVLTTVIAFIPFFFLDGMMGKVFWQMALVVIASLLFSLVEAFVILPSHLAHSKGLRPKKEISSIREKIEGYIKYLTHNIYAPILKASLKQKWITVMVPFALFLFTIGIIGGGFIGLTFFPFIGRDTIPINISMVAGRQEEDTNEVLRFIEDKVWEVNEELKESRFNGEDVIIGINRNIGSTSFGGQGSHTGQLIVQLMDGEIRNMDSYLIGNKIRDKVGDVSGVENIAYGATGRFGKAISISLLGSDYSQLDKARHLLIDELNNFETLKDVTDNDQKGRKELDIKLLPTAYALGLTLQDVARQVRQGFFGEEIQRIQRGRDEIRIWVRYNEDNREHLVSLDKMRIRTPDGGEYPFSELATYEIERGISAINHLDRMQEIKVEANQASMDDDLPPIMQDIEKNVIPKVLGQVEGVSVSFEGQSRDKEKIQSSMKIAFPLALITMFIVVVLVFRSYFQATLIFSMIPIGIIGAVWGHGIHGLQLNILSMYGVIALSGIIINDSIVLVDQVNRYLKEGQKVFDAVYNAGIARLRPILLTTITTSLGLAPLILETSRQAQFLIPMAIAVAYGLLFGTMILLLILPASFLVINSIRVKASKLTNPQYVNPEEVEPAVRELKIPSFE